MEIKVNWFYAKKAWKKPPNPPSMLTIYTKQSSAACFEMEPAILGFIYSESQ